MIFSIKGDEFALRDGGSLYCKEDHDVLEKSALTHHTSIEHNNNNIPMLNNNNTNMNNNTNHSTTILSNNNHSSELGSMSGKVIAVLFIYFINILKVYFYRQKYVL